MESLVSEVRLNLMMAWTNCLKHLKLSNQQIYQAKSSSFQYYIQVRIMYIMLNMVSSYRYGNT